MEVPMKKITVSLTAVICVVGFIGLTGIGSIGPDVCQAGELAPVVSLSSTMIKLSKKAEVVIMGAGFKPEQEINIVFITADGLKADVEYALKPAPMPDKTGSWNTTWSAGRFVDKKLVKAGTYRIVVFDGEYNQLAHTVISFAE
jgi:hypothetical protein